jgi:signal transduction histidine kinase
LNLIANAVDASPRRASCGSAESRSGLDGHDDVVVRIRDQGPGVPDSVREGCSSRFVTTRARHGLGLAVAFEHVTQHGGRLVLRNQEGSGAYLPVRISGLRGLSRWRGSSMVDSDAGIRGAFRCAA